MPGLDNSVIGRANSANIFAHIKKDVKTDLVVAPHFDRLYDHAAPPLWDEVQSLLRSGRYETDVPITMSVPKPRGFTRPGGILNPIDRVVYQLLGEELASSVEASLDRKRVFSDVLNTSSERDAMFVPHGESYREFRDALLALCERSPWFVKLDISNYYERFPQHIAINMLNTLGCDSAAVNLLEKVLLSFRGKSSIGLIQGLATSDLLGNFYLSTFDDSCAQRDYEAIRFVDDIYMPVSEYAVAKSRLLWSIDALRRDDLNVNEGKSGIFATTQIREEEIEVADRFSEMYENVLKTGVLDYVEEGYGFRVEFDDVPPELPEGLTEPEVAASAIKVLFEDDKVPSELVPKIDRFAFPVLTTLGDPAGIDRAVAGVTSRPYLAQIYLSYLARFVDWDADLEAGLKRMLIADGTGAYEKMLILATLFVAEEIADIGGAALTLMQDRSEEEPVRALAAMVAAKFGAATQKRAVRNQYENEGSIYMRLALLYASQFLSPGDRSTSKRLWGSHSRLAAMLAATI